MSRGQVAALRVAAGVAILAAWQICATAFAPNYIPRPSRTAAQIPSVLSNPQFLSGTASTLLAVIEGLIIAVLAGTVIGLVMGRLRDVDRALRLYVNSFYEAALPITFNVAEGGRSVSAGYVDVARAYRAPWWRVWTSVALPASLPYLLGGIDLAIGRALIGAVVAEFIAALNGAGYYILFNVRSFHQDDAVVAVCVLIAFVLALRGLVNLAVRRGLPWYQAA